MATGINISKANAYVVLSPPSGVCISKAVAYVVLDQAVAPSWPSFTFGSGVVGAVYSQSFSANGSAPITYTVQSGALPDGLSLSGETISGTPTVAGTFNFTLRATNAYGTADKAFSITITSASVAGVGGNWCYVA